MELNLERGDDEGVDEVNMEEGDALYREAREADGDEPSGS